MKANQLKKIITSLLTLIGFPLYGAVDIKTAALIEQFTDWTSKDQSFQLIRQYSSRRLKMGFFGLGWCSNIEDSLTVNPNGSLTLRTCLDGKEEIFFKETDRYLNPRTGSIIYFSDQKYRLLSSNQRLGTQIFDSAGNWIGAYMNGSKISLEKSQSTWRLKVNDEDLKLSFKSEFKNQLLESIQSTNQKWTYRYSHFNLVELKRSELDSVLFEYDKYQNMTSIKGLDFWRTFSYDNEKDQVLAVMDGDCLERYSYSRSLALPNSFQVDFSYSCFGQVPTRSRYNFLESSELGLRLKTLSTIGKGRESIIRYDKNERIESRVLVEEASI